MFHKQHQYLPYVIKFQLSSFSKNQFLSDTTRIQYLHVLAVVLVQKNAQRNFIGATSIKSNSDAM